MSSPKSTPNDLAGVRIIVTAGGTRERIDAVRFISNDSSGKMGYALAEAAANRAAEVVLITTVVRETVCDFEVVRVESASDMKLALEECVENAKVLIMAAAVSDFRVKNVIKGKLSRETGGQLMTLELVPTEDILKSITRPGLMKVAFAAETEDLERRALAKLEAKGAALIVANDITKANAGFNVDTNIVTMYRRNGRKIELPLLSKREVADEILNEVLELLGQGV